MVQKFLKYISLCVVCVLIVFSCRQSSEHVVTNENVENQLLLSLTELIRQSPQSHELYHRRALAYMSEEMFYEALSDVNQALQLSPQNTTYTITLGDIYFAMGNIENCRKALITAADNDPANVEPILKLAELDLILKDYDKMNLYLQKVLSIERHNSQAYFMQAIAFKEQGDTNKAMQSLIKATTYNPEHYDAFVQAGIITAHQRNPIAEEFLQTAINISPELTEARYALAMYYQDNEFIEQAVQQYNVILTIDPNHVLSHYNLGYIELVEKNNFKKSITHFTEAIKLNPNYAEAYYNRGYCYELIGEIEAARGDYQKALQVQTNFRKAIDGLNRLDRMIVVN
jgi:tetratricopeptide (TPR) repeat protein